MSKTEDSQAEPEEKGKTKRATSFYRIEGDQIIRTRPTCERCGPGYFMADHGDRYTCGHCGFTRYKPAESRK